MSGSGEYFEKDDCNFNGGRNGICGELSFDPMFSLTEKELGRSLPFADMGRPLRCPDGGLGTK